MSSGHNVLVVVTDEERAGGPWESSAMGKFRREQLPAHRRLAQRGVCFSEHRICSSACVPSRTSMFTGQTPWVHGVWQTDGLAKTHDDPQMRWLGPLRTPTLGHRVEAAGLESVYFGKWHLSSVDGVSDDAHEGRGPLGPFGFRGFTGPEPHGADPANSGIARDPGYVRQAAEWLRRRAQEPQRPPFVVVVSLVNPHDIVFWPLRVLASDSRLRVDDVPELPGGPTDGRVPADEPSVLSAYRRTYPAAYGPAPLVEAVYRRGAARYRRYYFSLMRLADRHLGSLLDVLDETGLADSTSVVFTSDHGELLGSHGGLHQKWYCAFEEVLRVPFVVASPRHTERAGTVEQGLSTHLDLVPTVLGLADLDATDDFAGADRFEVGQGLPGRDLLRVPLRDEGSSYFVTRDSVLEGAEPQRALARRFPTVGRVLPLRIPPLGAPNTAVEAIVATVEGPHGRTKVKLVRHFRPDRFEGSGQDEWSMFDLGQDPAEQTSIFGAAAWTSVAQELTRRLTRARGGSSPP